MNVQTMKNVAFAGASGFAVGTATAIGILCTMTVKTAGPSLMVIPGIALLFAGTAIAARVADEVFKKMGWSEHANTRCLTAHIIVGIALAGGFFAFMGPPVALCGFLAAIITTAALGVNLLMNDYQKKHKGEV